MEAKKKMYSVRSSGDGRIADIDEGTEGNSTSTCGGEDETAPTGHVDKDGNSVVFEVS